MHFPICPYVNSYNTMDMMRLSTSRSLCLGAMIMVPLASCALNVGPDYTEKIEGLSINSQFM